MKSRIGAPTRIMVVVALTAATLVAAQSSTSAVPAAPGAVFDDFDDGGTADWNFFGGNAAGGGGGPASDRPFAGAGYFSTGWGGNGTASSFYGGAFKNLPDVSQVVLPADPWLNMWVYQQSDTTVAQYNLELTLREDTNGDGWTDTLDDSIGLDTTFTAADFDDDWTLLSAPLSSFFNRGTGGNGVFDGNVDEFVIVFGGVEGGLATNIEIDFDEITFTSGGPAAFDAVVFDDMDHGDPFGNGWFSFVGGGGGGISPSNSDLPPELGGSFSLESGWGGPAGFLGGFGRTSPTDLSGTEYFNFWINPDAGQEYTIEINLQEDDNSDGAANPGDDDEFQFNCVVGAAGPCAVAGGGWQFVSIPLDDFFDDNSFFTGGNGVLDPTPAARGGNGELISVIMAIVGTGSNVNFRTDYWAFSLEPIDPAASASVIIDDFESGLPFGADGDGSPLGFYTFQGAGSSIGITTSATPPAPVLPAVGTPNNVLQMNIDSTSFAGYIHAFENATVDTWVPQDWSTSEGISFWFDGNNSGASMFIDILDNRAAGSTSDDAERWTVAFTDDFDGWKLYELPFSSFTRKEIGNGAPNDGLGLFEMHGYAFGALGTGGPQEFYFDQVALYGIAEPPALAVQFSQQNTFVDEGTTGQVGVKMNRPMGPDDPAQVSIDFATERSAAIPGEEYTPTSGTITFTNGGVNELFFPVETFDDTKFEGDEQIVIRLTNSVDVERGALFQGSVLIADDDSFDPDLLDDFEQGSFLWETTGLVDLQAQRVQVGDPDERPGQDQVENVGTASVLRSGPGFDEATQSVIDHLTSLLPTSSWFERWLINFAVYRLDQSLTPSYRENGFFLDHRSGSRVFDRTAPAVGVLEAVAARNGSAAAGAQAAVDALVAIDRTLAQDAIDVAVLNGADSGRVGKAQREMQRAEADIGRGWETKAIVHFRNAWRHATRAIDRLGSEPTLGSLVRDFPMGQDWAGTESLDFWFNGTGSGAEITVDLKDNRAPDPGPSGWSLAWADEFDDPAGTPPNPANWAYELGDTTPDGKNGWGNEELQYYTDDPDNAATDGNGNLVITLDEADPGQECYYGPCQFESARLITQNKAEFAYGRIESRLLVPDGGDGLWPAFWSLGTDITYNPWPGAGEIDVMEYVSRLPDEIFGTIHGPGYNGGGSFSGIYDDFGGRVDASYHTFTVEWEPNLIKWYVDGIQYHQAEPADVPGPWVFDKPFFLLLNFAIGGNFGGAPDPGNTYPQEFAVDYVRVYQGPDTAERFETTFTDSVAGWQQVSIPIGDFTRSADQPAGAPDDGLTLTDVWGYGFDVPYPAAGTYQFDLIRRTPVPPPTELVVTNLDDAGAGSLREALSLIADGGTITFDSGLAGGTLTLTSGQLDIDRSVTIDAPAAGVTVSAGGSSRVIEVGAGLTVDIDDVVIRDGAAAPQGGGILNNGVLSLDNVVVTDNTENSAGPANFAFGGGGIYNGDGATLNLTDSTVSNNSTANQPGGGIYGFFNSTINITRSTVSGNVGGDVAGGLRSLGNVTVVNSTFSDNTSSAWHGGAMFLTDGVVTISNTTIVGNNSPGGTAGGLMVATFGAPVTVALEDNVIADNGTYNCQVEGGAAAVLTSLGGNVSTDSSCAPIGSDQVVGPGGALVDVLADNGGPTLTHALLAGSPAIDGAVGACPATDQRGVARPLGGTCDAGSVEMAP